MLRTLTPLDIGIATNIPFDLHVLSTPPAFVLSQNQTLREKRMRFTAELTGVKSPKFARTAAKAVAKSDRSYLLVASTRRLSALAGFVRSYFELIETKDLTCNAQFNFCLLSTPSCLGAFVTVLSLLIPRRSVPPASFRCGAICARGVV